MSLVASNRSPNENRQLQTARCSPTFFTYCRSFSRAFCTSPMFLQICCSPTDENPNNKAVWRANLVAHHPPVGLQPMVRSQGLSKAQIVGIWIGIYGGFYQFSLNRAASSSRLWEMLPEDWGESGETARVYEAVLEAMPQAPMQISKCFTQPRIRGVWGWARRVCSASRIFSGLETLSVIEKREQTNKQTSKQTNKQTDRKKKQTKKKNKTENKLTVFCWSSRIYKSSCQLVCLLVHHANVKTVHDCRFWHFGLLRPCALAYFPTFIFIQSFIHAYIYPFIHLSKRSFIKNIRSLESFIL